MPAATRGESTSLANMDRCITFVNLTCTIFIYIHDLHLFTETSEVTMNNQSIEVTLHERLIVEILDTS